MLSDFSYYRPETIEEAYMIASKYPDTYSYIAGGTDLLSSINNGIKNPKHIVDIKKIKSMFDFEETKDGLFIGAAVTANVFLESDFVTSYPPLAESLAHLASYQIRNRATIVGNICNASPCANTITSLCVLGAEVIIYTGKDQRTVLVEDFIKGVKKTDLKLFEIIVGLRIPKQFKDVRGGFLEKTRVKGPDIGSANVACLVAQSKSMVRVGLGSLSPAPIVLDFSELFGDNSIPFENKIERVLDEVEKNIKPITDIRSTQDYRTVIAKVYTKRLITALWKEKQ